MKIETAITVSGIDYDHLLGGGVQIGTSDISRQLSLSCIGDISDLDDAALSSTVVSVSYVMDGDATQVFEGPLVRVSRSGRLFELEANDYAHFGLAPYRVYEPFTIASGTNLGDAVNRIAEEMGLTTSASAAPTLMRPLSVERGAEPWRVIKDLCAAAGRIVYFSRTGSLVIKRKPKPADTPDWTLTNDELFSEPKLTWDTSGLRTGVEVIANLPCDEVAYGFAGSTTRPVALESIETEDVEDEAGADALAEDALEDFGIVQVSADFEAMPKPDIEPWWKVNADGRNFMVDTAGINLNGTSAMGIGGSRSRRSHALQAIHAGAQRGGWVAGPRTGQWP